MDNPIAQETGRWIKKRVTVLKKSGASLDPEAESFNAEYAVLSRVADFEFEDYPDYTAPWHLLRHSPMNWDHVFDLVTIMEYFHQVKGFDAGQPLVLPPFQVFITACFTGPVNPATGLKMIRTGLLTLARKNGKTTYVSALTGALMVLDPEAGGFLRQDIYVTASDREQAAEIYESVSGFTVQDTSLGIADDFRCIPSRKTMANVHTLTKLKVLSSDAFRAHGRNPRLVLYDEIGNVNPAQAREMYSVLSSGFGAQPEGFIGLLSTQAPVDQHLFSEMVDRCKLINSGQEVDHETAGFVFEVPETLNGVKVDPFDEALWYLGNPMVRSSDFLLADLRKQAAEARSLPAMASAFVNLRLNRRANPFNPLLSKEIWVSCGTGFDQQALYGRSCHIALDLSTITDLTALVAVFEPLEPDEPRPVLAYFWIPGEGLRDRARRDKVPFDVWVAEGLIDTESRKTIDYELVADKLIEMMSDYDVLGVGFDRWRIKDLQAILRTRGHEELMDDKEFFFPIGQGYKEANACVEALERAVLNGTIAHGGNPVLTWNAANAVTETDPAGGRKFNKSKSYGRIDGIVALAMALRVPELQAQEEDDGPSAFASDDCLM